MQIHKLTVSVLDFDQLGAEDVRLVLESTRFANDCISPKVHAIETRDIGEWSDDSPLNRRGTAAAEFDRLFARAPASAPVASIDTQEFSQLMCAYLNSQTDPCAAGQVWKSRDALVAHIDAWGQQQRKEGYREGRVSAHRAAQEQAARTTSDIAYESLSPERRKKFDADMVLLDQRMQDHRRERERRQHVVPVEVERRVADARGTGVHQDRKPS